MDILFVVCQLFYSLGSYAVVIIRIVFVGDVRNKKYFCVVFTSQLIASFGDYLQKILMPSA